MGELMSKKLVKPILNGILFLGVFLFAHTYLKKCFLHTLFTCRYTNVTRWYIWHRSYFIHFN